MIRRTRNSQIIAPLSLRMNRTGDDVKLSGETDEDDLDLDYGWRGFQMLITFRSSQATVLLPTPSRAQSLAQSH